MEAIESRNRDDLGREIVAQIAELSKLLGMVPSNDTITVSEPVTLKSEES